MIVTLRSSRLVIDIDPEAGAEIRSIRVGPEGDGLLAQTPWPRAPAAIPADEATWTRRWPGGWQVLCPNAGAACVVERRPHGFHGDTSLARWDLVERSSDAVFLRCRTSDDLVLERHVGVAGSTVDAQLEIRNESGRPRALVLVEHLILGPRLAGPGTRITTGESALVALDPESGLPTAGDGRWPVGADGADWSRAPNGPFTRFGTLVAPARRSINVSDAAGRLAVRVAWDGELLRHLWFWHEHHEAELVDGYTINCLGIEPASTPHGAGLRRSIETGDASTLEPGAAVRSRVRLEVLTPV